MVNNSTAFHYQQISDGEGRFAFGLLSPGDYSARVTADKMSPQLSPFLRVTLGGVTEIQFKLQIAGPRENVTVSAEPREVETEPRGVSAVIDERAILNLPLNGRRFTDLSLLTSQTTTDPESCLRTPLAHICSNMALQLVVRWWCLPPMTAVTGPRTR